jgi:hypothetical protein
MLIDSLSPRLLKTVQLQGGTTHPPDGSQQMGRFQLFGRLLKTVQLQGGARRAE